MKTPDEIKKGLRLFASELDDIVALCNVEEATGLLEEVRNKMFEAANCIEEMDSDLNAWGGVASSPGAVEDMERENYRLVSRLAQVEKERDAAVSELPHNCWNCIYHLKNPIEETDDNGRTIRIYCSAEYCFPDDNSSWQWRGVCAENTEEETNDEK